jgi:hypothetical protein
VIFADIAYLPYMGAEEAGHFGGHTVVVYGIDEDQDKVFISDRAKKPVSVTVDDLKRARGSKFPPFAPKHAFLDIRHPSNAEIGAEDVLRGINHTVNSLTDPPFSGAGLKGMSKWADLVLKWPSMFKGKRMLDVLITCFIYIELGGTGGSAFRPMYCRFLEEAKDILGEPSLSSAIERYTEAGRIWSEIADLYLPDEYPVLRHIKELQWESDGVLHEMEDGYLEKMASIQKEADVAYSDGAKEVKQADKFLPAVRDKILELKEVETQAATILKESIS